MEDQALKWWHVRWGLAGRVIIRPAVIFGKVLGVICLLAAIGWGVLYLLSPWLEARRLADFDPRLNLTPVGLPSNAEAALLGPIVEHYGFKFSMPSGAFRDGSESKYFTIMSFRDGGLLFHNPSDENDWFFLKTIRDDKDAQNLLGQETLRSKFSLLQAAMSTTPDQVKWWRFRSTENKTKDLLLIAKLLAFTQIVSSHLSAIQPIHKVAIGEMHGFQLGDVNAPPYDAELDLFDKADHPLRFEVNGAAGHGPVLTQAELNAMIASIRPTSNR